MTDRCIRGKDLQQQQQQLLLLLSRAGRGATYTIWATPMELNLGAKFRSYILLFEVCIFITLNHDSLPRIYTHLVSTPREPQRAMCSI